mmetsp:Transcript_7659/g.8843  ORF Transcript_7659/g.8843 Transcript_7659/m.8843 type:complete len:367 (+) Transcript_7659:3-1103(+)
MLCNNEEAASLKDQGDVLVTQKLYAEAAEKYKEAIDLYPNVAAYHSNLSHCYKCLGNYKEAELSARRVVRLNPEKKSLLVKGFWRLARALLAQNENSSDNQNFDLKHFKHQENRLREAAEALRLAKKMDPNNIALVHELTKTEAECQKSGIRADSDGSWYDLDNYFYTYDEYDEYSDSEEKEDSNLIQSDDESHDGSILVPKMMYDSESPPLDDKAYNESSSDESMPPLYDRMDSDSSSESDSDSDGDISGLRIRRGDSSDSDSDDSYIEIRSWEEEFTRFMNDTVLRIYDDVLRFQYDYDSDSDDDAPRPPPGNNRRMNAIQHRWREEEQKRKRDAERLRLRINQKQRRYDRTRRKANKREKRHT